MAVRAIDSRLVFSLAPCRRLIGSIAGVHRGIARLGRFPNGKLHARVETPVDGRECFVVGSVSPPEERVARVTLLAHCLRRAGARSVTAVLPYLAYAVRTAPTPVRRWDSRGSANCWALRASTSS